MTRTKRSAGSARGSATLELALGLPLLFTLLVTIYMVASVDQTRIAAAHAARLKASSGTDTPWQESPDYTLVDLLLPNLDLFAKILGPHPPYSPRAGLVSAQETRDVPYVATPWRGLIPAAQAKCTTGGGSWDKRQIPFPQQAEHPQLVMVEKVQYLADGHDVPLDAFTALADLDGRALGALDLGAVTAGMDKLREPVKAESASVVRRRNEVVNLIDTTERELNAALHAVPRDEGLISQLRKKLDSLRAELACLNRAADDLKVGIPQINNGSRK